MSLHIKRLCEQIQAISVCLSRRLCLRACVLWDSVKCIMAICLFAFKRRRVLTYADHADERRLSLGMLVSSVVVLAARCTFFGPFSSWTFQ